MKKESIEDGINFVNWDKTGLTVNFQDKESISRCLTSQVKMNEDSPNGNAQFNRLSIPLIIRAFTESKAAKRNRFTNFFDENLKPRFIFFKEKFREAPVNFQYSFEEETKYCADLAHVLAQEIDEIFNNVVNTDIIFHGLVHLSDGTIALAYN